MAEAFWMLRDALRLLALDADAQRTELKGMVITDELALDFDNAVGALSHEMSSSGITLSADVQRRLRELNTNFDLPPGNTVWDDDALDQHPVWVSARTQARKLLTEIPTG